MARPFLSAFLGLALAGCSTLPPMAPPPPALTRCVSASLTAAIACPDGALQTPACIDATLQAALVCAPQV